MKICNRSIALCAVIFVPLSGCSKSPGPGLPEDPSQFSISGLATDKSEKFSSYSERTEITYTTTGFLNRIGANAKAPAFVYLATVETNGFRKTGSRPEFQEVIVSGGRGEITFSDTRSLKSGQVYPPTPKYEYAIAGVEELEIAVLTMGKERSVPRDDGGPDAPLIELSMGPTEVLQKENEFSKDLKYYSALTRGKLLAQTPELKTTPILATFALVATAHPNPENVGVKRYTTVLMQDGEGEFRLDEYLDDKPTVNPAYQAELVGFKRLSHGELVAAK